MRDGRGPVSARRGPSLIARGWMESAKLRDDAGKQRGGRLRTRLWAADPTLCVSGSNPVFMQWDGLTPSTFASTDMVCFACRGAPLESRTIRAPSQEREGGRCSLPGLLEAVPYIERVARTNQRTPRPGHRIVVCVWRVKRPSCRRRQSMRHAWLRSCSSV